jgi:ribonuclease PH
MAKRTRDPGTANPTAPPAAGRGLDPAAAPTGDAPAAGGTPERRPAGRTARGIRPLAFELGYQRHADSSCLVRAGGTTVLCAVTIDEKIPHFLRGKGQGWITAEYAMLPRSTQQRTQRDGFRGRIGGRSHEIQRLIGRSLRAVADLGALGERVLIVDCDVLEADGGTRTASISGGFVALVLAVQRLKEQHAIESQILGDYLAAISVGIVDGRVLTDLDYLEDSGAEVDMNVVMTRSGHFVELQGTAEGRCFSEEELEAMLTMARGGIRRIITEQRRALGGPRNLP